ncbi:MAG: helix-turn-helix domain-containing protein [Opitutaceae bacterium]|jgi:transcriptional regulator with XRE-family HTH domain|nr:helix-turn-helix domain-containing protein [Opitutaceae bacterium]
MPGKTKGRPRLAQRPWRPGKSLNALGPELRKRRSALGWSQAVLAAKCQLAGWDIDRVVVAKIEAGLRAVSDLELLKLGEIVAATPNELLRVSARESR